MRSGYESILQAIEFARSLDIPTQDLPWDPDSIYKLANPEGRGMMQSDLRKLVDAHEEVTGWDFDKYLDVRDEMYPHWAEDPE